MAGSPRTCLLANFLFHHVQFFLCMQVPTCILTGMNNVEAVCITKVARVCCCKVQHLLWLELLGMQQS